MTSAPERATLRPPKAPVGRRGAVRRSRLVFTSGSVQTRGVDGADRASTYDVVALVDNPVRLPGDDQAADAGTLGLRFADGTAAYLRLADWDQPWLTPQECRATKRALARRLGVRLQSATDGDAPSRMWRPPAPALSGLWIARLGNIVPGLLVIAMLVAVPIGSWTGSDSDELRGMTRVLLLAAAACSLLLVVLLWTRWLVQRGREGTLVPDEEVRPRPKDPVGRRFLRTARLLRLDGEVCVRDEHGEELWIGGPADDFGVRRAEIGPGFRWEEPHCHAVNLVDADGRAIASLDRDDWFGTPESLTDLQGYCEGLGIRADDLKPTQNKRAQYNLYRSSPRGSESLKSAGLADVELISMAGVATLVAVAGLQFEMPTVSLVAVVPVALLVVPGLARTAARHLWLNKPATRA